MASEEIYSANKKQRLNKEDSVPEVLEEVHKPAELHHVAACPILSIAEAAEKLRAGEVVGFPTETVFGLGADATNDEAVAKIFRAKGRPSDNPLIVHVASMDQITFVKEIPEAARKLGDEFWPGPLSIVFEHSHGICERVRAGLDTIAVRIPSHPVALELLRKANVPVAAPSANTSGKPSPTRTEHVVHDLTGRIAGVVHGASCDVGLESTVVRLFSQPDGSCEAIILRPGGVTQEMIAKVIPNVSLDSALKSEKETPLAPGMKYKHYAPDAPLVILKGSDEFFKKTVEDALDTAGVTIGVMVSKESPCLKFLEANERIEVRILGAKSDLPEISQNLFHSLRSLDGSGVSRIFSECFANTGLGEALMNRLMKAASNQVLIESS